MTEPFGHLTRRLAIPIYAVTEPFGQRFRGDKQCPDTDCYQSRPIREKQQEIGWTFRPAQILTRGQPPRGKQIVSLPMFRVANIGMTNEWGAPW